MIFSSATARGFLSSSFSSCSRIQNLEFKSARIILVRPGICRDTPRSRNVSQNPRTVAVDTTRFGTPSSTITSSKSGPRLGEWSFFMRCQVGGELHTNVGWLEVSPLKEGYNDSPRATAYSTNQYAYIAPIVACTRHAAVFDHILPGTVDKMAWEMEDASSSLDARRIHDKWPVTILPTISQVLTQSSQHACHIGRGRHVDSASSFQRSSFQGSSFQRFSFQSSAFQDVSPRPAF